MTKKRIHTHRIDTKAVRTIFIQLSEDWLVRSLDERDYGIDLQLERFSGDDATGDFIFVQVKGTDDPFENEVKLPNFPTDTIKYAQLFNVPFFLFHTSNASKETKFVWLQKYAETKLLITTPNWEEQKSVTISFPIENDLKKHADKIINVIEKDKLKKVGIKFLTSYESLLVHADFVMSGEIKMAAYCAAESRNIPLMKRFIKEFGAIIKGDEFSNLARLPKTFEHIAEQNKVSEDDKSLIRDSLDWLREIKVNFLMSDKTDLFAAAMNDAPY